MTLDNIFIPIYQAGGVSTGVTNIASYTHIYVLQPPTTLVVRISRSNEAIDRDRDTPRPNPGTQVARRLAAAHRHVKRRIQHSDSDVLCRELIHFARGELRDAARELFMRQ